MAFFHTYFKAKEKVLMVYQKDYIEHGYYNVATNINIMLIDSLIFTDFHFQLEITATCGFVVKTKMHRARNSILVRNFQVSFL